MVNPNEAPEGYMAMAYVVGTSSCGECSFSSHECGCVAAGVSCLAYKRDDNCGVYFIPKKEPKEMSHAGTQPVQKEPKEMSHTEDAQHVPSVIPGISLRDYFAGCALTGILVDASLSQAAVVTFAYEVADAMLEQREKPLNGGDNAANN